MSAAARGLTLSLEDADHIRKAFRELASSSGSQRRRQVPEATDTTAVGSAADRLPGASGAVRSVEVCRFVR